MKDSNYYLNNSDELQYELSFDISKYIILNTWPCILSCPLNYVKIKLLFVQPNLTKMNVKGKKLFFVCVQ